MKKIYLYTLLSVVLGMNPSTAQEKQIEEANNSFEQYQLIDAQKAYLKVVEKGYTSKSIYQNLGDSYYFNADLEKAAKWYAKLYYEYKDEINPEYLFRYSHTLKNLKQYANADKVMEDFNKKVGYKEERSKLFNKERDYLKLIELQSGKFEIKNLEINSESSDFGPSFFKDDLLIFASSRGAKTSKVVHEWTKDNFLDLYQANRSGKNSTDVSNLESIKGVNTKLHESSTVFTKDGNVMYFTRNNFTNKNRKTNSKGTTLLKLYKATKGENNKWTDVKELPFNSDEYSVAHPALSNDETKLYFASDMPGTLGLSDIFYVDIEGEDSYGEPKNLGKGINTEGRETFPFISKLGRLFFASDGHIGLGGLDVFVAKREIGFGGFTTPYNLGKPINSPDDDFSFIIDEDTQLGYFTSNREGGKGNDDIYSFVQKEPLIDSCNQYLSGVVTDAETRAILPGTKVTLFDGNLKEIASDIANQNAEYSLPIDCSKSYVIRAENNKYAPTEVDFVSDGVFEFKHNQPIQLRKGVRKLGVEKVKVGDDLAKILQLNPIYFDFDKSFIRPDAEIELQKVIAVMQEYPNMHIDVRSHTDSRAPYAYNEALSQRRNVSTIAYIVAKGGISQGRLTGRGYGESILTNRCADGVDCSEAEHQRNRRSEFIIVKQ